MVRPHGTTSSKPPHRVLWQRAVSSPKITASHREEHKHHGCGWVCTCVCVCGGRWVWVGVVCCMLVTKLCFSLFLFLLLFFFFFFKSWLKNRVTFYTGSLSWKDVKTTPRRGSRKHYTTDPKSCILARPKKTLLNSRHKTSPSNCPSHLSGFVLCASMHASSTDDFISLKTIKTAGDSVHHVERSALGSSLHPCRSNSCFSPMLMQLAVNVLWPSWPDTYAEIWTLCL